MRASDLTVFPIAQHGPDGHQGGNGEEGEDLVGYLVQAAPTDKDGADGIYEVMHGVDVGGEIQELDIWDVSCVFFHTDSAYFVDSNSFYKQTCKISVL